MWMMMRKKKKNELCVCVCVVFECAGAQVEENQSCKEHGNVAELLRGGENNPRGGVKFQYVEESPCAVSGSGLAISNYFPLRINVFMLD